MKARSVARELALLILFQSDRKEDIARLEKASFEELIVNTVRCLMGLAQEQIQTVYEALEEARTFLIDHEIMHPDNENTPLEEPTKSVPVPNTHEMAQLFDKVTTGLEHLEEALYLPEFNALSEREDTRNYCFMLIRNVQTHHAALDQKLNEASTDWRVDRFQKMDLILLRLALGELEYSPPEDPATVVDEYLDLANRFTTEESRKFIHGLLGSITQKSIETVG